MKNLKLTLLTVVHLVFLANSAQAHYDPNIGRWLSRDSIEENGGANLYGFVGNDGINWWDYLGYSKITIYVQRFSDNQAQGLEFRSNSATLGELLMTVEEDDQSCDCPYPKPLGGVTIEQPRGARNLFGINGSSKEYPIPKGDYTTTKVEQAPGGTGGFLLSGISRFSGVYIHTGSSASSSEGCIIVGGSHQKGAFKDTFFLANPNDPETQRKVANGEWEHVPSTKFKNRYRGSSGPDASGISGSSEKIQQMLEFFEKVKTIDAGCNAKTTIVTKVTDAVPAPN